MIEDFRLTGKAKKMKLMYGDETLMGGKHKRRLKPVKILYEPIDSVEGTET